MPWVGLLNLLNFVRFKWLLRANNCKPKSTMNPKCIGIGGIVEQLRFRKCSRSEIFCWEQTSKIRHSSMTEKIRAAVWFMFTASCSPSHWNLFWASFSCCLSWRDLVRTISFTYTRCSLKSKRFFCAGILSYSPFIRVSFRQTRTHTVAASSAAFRCVIIVTWHTGRANNRTQRRTASNILSSTVHAFWQYSIPDDWFALRLLS